MAGEEIILVIGFLGLMFIYTAFATLYILAAGRVGLFAVKRRIPMVYPSGTIIIKGFNSGYVDIDYATYKEKLKWGSFFGPRDKRLTYVGKPQNIERSTGIPILFAKEGEVTNFDPFNSREPEKGSALFSEIAIAEHSAGFNEARQKFEGNDNVATLTLIAAGLSFLGVFAIIILTFGELEILNQVLEIAEGINPTVKTAVAEALKNVPSDRIIKISL